MMNILRTQKLSTTKFFFFFETRCNNSTFADRLFKSVFKSWQFEKKRLLYTTYLSAFVDKIIIEIGNALTSR